MIVVLLLSTLIQPPTDATAVSLSGERFQGAIRQLTDQHVELAQSDGTALIQLQDLERLIVQPVVQDRAPNTIVVRLVDGSVLLAGDYRVTDRQATMTLLTGGQVRVATRDIQAVRFGTPAASPGRDQQWQEWVSGNATADMLILRKTVESPQGDEDITLDAFDGILEDITDEQIQFRMDDQQVEVKRSRVEGVVYFHASGRQLPEPVCRLVDRHGGDIQTQSMQMVDDQMEVTSVCGTKFRLPLTQVSELDFTHGKIVYLSDLQPLSYQWTPHIGGGAEMNRLAQFFRYRINESVSGQPLTLYNQEGFGTATGDSHLAASQPRIKTFSHGLGLRSRSVLIYRLPDGFTRLVGLAGIDPNVREKGHVELILVGDGRELLRTVITGRDPQPLALDLDVSSVRRLSIEVGQGEQSDLCDHLNLCNLRIVK